MTKVTMFTYTHEHPDIEQDSFHYTGRAGRKHGEKGHQEVWISARLWRGMLAGSLVEANIPQDQYTNIIVYFN